VGTLCVLLSGCLRYRRGRYFIKALAGKFKSPDMDLPSGFHELAISGLSIGECRGFLANYLKKEANPVIL
jgi:hypothetical protein